VEAESFRSSLVLLDGVGFDSVSRFCVAPHPQTTQFGGVELDGRQPEWSDTRAQ
jgi:hypothetical protein